MTIQWYGHACFKITGNTRDVSVLIDPFDASCGLRPPKNTSDITLVTTQNKLHNTIGSKGEKNSSFLIQYPGEYEVGGAFIYGVQLGSTIMYSVGLDELFVVHMGSLTRQLTATEIDQLGRVDILIVPVGGKQFSVREVCECISQLEPRIVIPMQYAIPGLKEDYGPLETFLKEFGVKDCEKSEKFKIMKKDLPVGDTTLVCLNPI